jgi:hypothetical protein
LVYAKQLQTNKALESWRKGLSLLSRSKDCEDRVKFAFYSLVLRDAGAVPMDRILKDFNASEGMIRDLLIDAEIIAGSGAKSPQIEQAVKTLALALASQPPK